MGCCNSKEQTKKPVHTPVVNSPVAEQAEEVVVKEDDLLLQRLLKMKDRLDQVNAAKSTGFRYNKCTVEGEVSSFFPPKGLCFRIICDDAWFFYNDTLNYEMHVSYRFGPDSDVNPAARAKVETAENGWTTISTVLYPLETVKFLSGATDVYMTDVSAYPLSDEYFSKLNVVSRATAEEIRRVNELTYGSANEDDTLQRCIETNTPFVDLNFPPSAAMLSRPGIDARRMPTTEIQRLGVSLAGQNARTSTIRDVVIPQCIDGGILGDNWFACAMAILAENEERVKELFAFSTAEEQRIGAYRVLLNKDGWWTSVLLDDFLPMVNNVPCFARVLDDPSEMWVSLLQKAYAKVHGSYVSITGGDTTLALRDFTGAPTYRLDEEWARAAQYDDELNSLLDRIARYVEAGNIVMLNTPAGRNVERCARVGLRDGYAYLVEAVQRFPGDRLTLLKMRNPWEPAAAWAGAWCAGSSKWENYPDVQRGCNPDFTLNDGSFWVELAEAAKYFDGCGVVFAAREPTYDYRVRGTFDHAHPNVVLMVNVAKRAEVVLTLTQKDKRGVDIRTPDAKLSPIMLSVSRADGNKQRVHQCSSSDPECPTEEYNFIIAREVAMTYTFNPSDAPYFIIPRIHSKGIGAAEQKEFVLGIRSSTPLDGKLDVQFTTLDASSRVFQNRVTFFIEDTMEVGRLWQLKAPGEAVVVNTGSRMSSANCVQRDDVNVEDEKGSEKDCNDEALAFDNAAALKKAQDHEETNGTTVDENGVSLSDLVKQTMDTNAEMPSTSQNGYATHHETPFADGRVSEAGRNGVENGSLGPK